MSNIATRPNKNQINKIDSIANRIINLRTYLMNSIYSFDDICKISTNGITDIELKLAQIDLEQRFNEILFAIQRLETVLNDKDPLINFAYNRNKKFRKETTITEVKKLGDAIHESRTTLYLINNISQPPYAFRNKYITRKNFLNKLTKNN